MATLPVKIKYTVPGDGKPQEYSSRANDAKGDGLTVDDKHAVDSVVSTWKQGPGKEEGAKIVSITVGNKTANSVAGLFAEKPPTKKEEKPAEKAKPPAEKKGDKGEITVGLRSSIDVAMGRTRPAPKPPKVVKPTAGKVVKGTGAAATKAPTNAKTVETTKIDETTDEASNDRVFKGTISYKEDGKSSLKKGVTKGSDGKYYQDGKEVKNAFAGGGKKTKEIDFQYVRSKKDRDGLTEERAENIVNLVESKLPDGLEVDPNEVKVDLHPADMPPNADGTPRYENGQISLTDLKNYANGDDRDPYLKKDEDKEHPFGKLGDDEMDSYTRSLLTTDFSQIDRRKEKWGQFLQFLMMMIAGGNTSLIGAALSVLGRIFSEGNSKEMLRLAQASKKLLKQKEAIQKEMAKLFESSDKKGSKAGALRAKRIELDSQLEAVQMNIRQLFERLRETKADSDVMAAAVKSWYDSDIAERRFRSRGALS